LRDPVVSSQKDRMNVKRQSEREETLYLREGSDYGQRCPCLSKVSEELFKN
jgi:hypothetical protein